MNNRNRSPLYIYIESKIIDESVNKAILQKAKTVIDNLVTTCCLSTPPTKNAFLKGFYSLLKTMPKKYSLNKYKAVQTLLADKIACCP